MSTKKRSLKALCWYFPHSIMLVCVLVCCIWCCTCLWVKVNQSCHRPGQSGVPVCSRMFGDIVLILWYTLVSLVNKSNMSHQIHELRQSTRLIWIGQIHNTWDDFNKYKICLKWSRTASPHHFHHYSLPYSNQLESYWTSDTICER